MLKACLCGRHYDAASWARLRLVGYQRNGVSNGLVFEMRQCGCGSALIVDTMELAASTSEADPTSG